MKLPVSKVNELERMITRPSSLYAQVSIEGEAELIDLIEDERLQLPHEQTNRIFKEKILAKMQDIRSH